jgi:hypothetical protein
MGKMASPEDEALPNGVSDRSNDGSAMSVILTPRPAAPAKK